MTEETPEAHLAWAKERALEYLHRGDVVHAVASMISDLGKHEETRELRTPELVRRGSQAALDDAAEALVDAPRVRRWIEGFKWPPAGAGDAR
jgi:hypothetical protein